MCLSISSSLYPYLSVFATYFTNGPENDLTSDDVTRMVDKNNIEKTDKIVIETFLLDCGTFSLFDTHDQSHPIWR